ncbi:hypothetical protein T439DRAFT_347643 [Meredithblackwellia eburnea MCA 4105]
MSYSPSNKVSSKEAAALTGPILAGHLTNILLYGFLLCTFLNFVQRPSWRTLSRPHRTILLLVLALVTVEVGLGVNDIVYFGTNISDDFAVFGDGNPAEDYEPLVTGLVACLCQSVLAMRALKITDNVYIRYVCLVIFGSIVLLESIWSAMLCYFSVQFQKENYTATIGKLGLDQSLFLWMWFAAGADTIITATYISIIIRRMKQQSEAGRSVTKLIIKGAIQSAFYTAFMALATAITTQITTNDGPMIYILPYAFWLPLSSLYALSLFATLSIGDKVTEKVRAEHSISLQRESKFQPELSVGAMEIGAAADEHVGGNGSLSTNPMAGLRQPSLFGSTISIDRRD